MIKHKKLVEVIEATNDVNKLRNWIDNARREKAGNVEAAAIKRLVEVNALTNHDAPNDPLVLDFWKSITALEFALSDERNKTTRLGRTRQKIKRVGVKRTLEDLTMSTTPSEGFYLLRDRNMTEMSAEAVVLRHQEQFDEAVLKAAQSRLDTKDKQAAN